LSGREHVRTATPACPGQSACHSVIELCRDDIYRVLGLTIAAELNVGVLETVQIVKVPIGTGLAGTFDIGLR
jgi:hypothetical protein